MPTYEYQCRNCGALHEFIGSIREHEEYRAGACYLDFECRECHGKLKRKFSFVVKPAMPDHFNHSAGTYVRNEQQLKDEFKRQSDIMSERLGFENRFVPVDPHEKEALGVTDEGLAETYNRRKELGMKIPEVIKPHRLG